MKNNRPNILWICSDQQRWDTLGCYGNEFVRTPNLDQLAARGTCFECAFSQSPVCTPSRAAFLTGRYPRACGGRQNGAEVPDREMLVTKRLADAGYVCGLSGKLHLRPAHPRRLGPGGMESRFDDGYSVFHWSHHGGSMGSSRNHYWDWLAKQGLRHTSEPFEGSRTVSTSMTGETSQAAWCAHMAVDFIEERAKDGKPWLFSVNPFDPHAAFDPPREFLEPYLSRLDRIPLPNYVEGELDDKPRWQRWDHERGGYGHEPAFAWGRLNERDHRLIRAAYWAMCDQLDEQVGRMLEALERTGQRDNTIVIYTSDHGELLGDHGMYMKGPFFYDCSIRVPLIVSWPGRIRAQRSPALVELLDLPQTLLDAVGLAHHPGMMGKSLWPLLRGEAPPDRHRDDVYCEFYNSCEGHNGGCELPAMATMARTSRYKLALAHGEGTGELYDLRDDPRETRNLWGNPAYAAVERDMLIRLADRMAFTCDPLPPRVAQW
ncbi:MAG: sulfatase-like hydrolase/transferase [Candidatus Sumerlaeota bacterium]|nr:sulfatase-like hydrolase/transferase [Candidatus Sumerlaeota bacterium]